LLLLLLLLLLRSLLAAALRLRSRLKVIVPAAIAAIAVGPLHLHGLMESCSFTALKFASVQNARAVAAFSELPFIGPRYAHTLYSTHAAAPSSLGEF
jgi:hypothetical protein